MNRKRSSLIAATLTTVLTFFGAAALWAGDGDDRADEIVERVESTQTSSSAQEKLVKEIAEAAEEAGKANPDDADAVAEAVKNKLDEIRDRKSKGGEAGGGNNKEIREWVKKLKRDLMDTDLVSVPATARPGEDQATAITERVECAPASSSNEEKLIDEIARTAESAGQANPNNAAAVKQAVRAKLDEIRERPNRGSSPGGQRNQGVRDWINTLKRDLMGRRYISYVAPEGTRVVMTGRVSSGEVATASVVSPGGGTLSGVVVEIDGESYETDESGRVSFLAPAAIGGLVVASLPQLAQSDSRAVIVESAPAAACNCPTLDEVPDYFLPGEEITVSGSELVGPTDTTSVWIDDTPLNVLASSPGELIVATAADLAPGEHQLSVEAEGEASEPHTITAVALRFEADTKLRTGQTGMGALVVSGTERPVTLEITNLTPQVVRLAGGNPLVVRSSGGDENRSAVSYQAVGPGGFQLSATVIEREDD